MTTDGYGYSIEEVFSRLYAMRWWWLRGSLGLKPRCRCHAISNTFKTITINDSQ
jgi:hypothetical protein